MRKKIHVLAIATLLMMGMAGCQGKKEDATESKVNTISEVTEAQTDTDAMVIEDVVADNDYDVPEEFSYHSTGTMGSVDITATIHQPENFTNCPIYRLDNNNHTFTDEDVAYYVEKIFDEGSYFLFMPSDDEQIEKLRSKFSAIEPTLTDEREKRAFTYVYNTLNYYEENPMSNDTGEVVEDEIRMYDFIGYEAYGNGNCYVAGTVDGKYAILSFYSTTDACRMDLRFFNSLGDEITDVSDADIDSSTVNNCIYTKEEAQELATEYLEMLGIEDMRLVRTSNIMLGTCDEAESEPEYLNDYSREGDILRVTGYCTAWENNGYYIYFRRGYGDFTMPYDGECEFYKGNGNEFIKVYVTDDGVSEVEYANHMTVEEHVGNNTSILDFESIEQIAKDCFDKLANIDDTPVTITNGTIELVYSVSEEDGYLVLVPTWRFYNIDNNQKLCYLEINAIDGSVLSDWYYLY